MSVRKIFRRSDLERVAARFSTDTVEDIIRCSDKVLANGTNLAMQQIFLPAADENPFAEFKVIDDACDKLESFWKPRIQQYICSRVLDADPKTFDKIGNGDESWAISVARETRDMLMSEASLGHHPPYGLPRPLASAPVDQGGYDGWDRNLLLSPYQMQGVTGTIVDFVPHDAPGMTDALACLAIYEAIDNLTVPSEAYQLSVAKSFTPSCDLDGLSWDSARAARQLAKLHMRARQEPPALRIVRYANMPGKIRRKGHQAQRADFGGRVACGGGSCGQHRRRALGHAENGCRAGMYPCVRTRWNNHTTDFRRTHAILSSSRSDGCPCCDGGRQGQESSLVPLRRGYVPATTARQHRTSVHRLYSRLGSLC